MTGGCPRETTVKIRVGYELIYDCPQPTPMMLVLNVHYTRASDILVADRVTTEPSVLLADYRDGFDNWCTRLVAPKGQIRISSTAVVKDSREPDIVATSAHQHSIQDLPDESLVFLLGSRYCDTQRLSETAWSLFGQTPPGWARVQAICDFVHNHISFGYEHARDTRTAWEAFNERRGVCRDYAHLAIAFCRCMNIPARYCSGYLSDIGVPPPYGPMDFAGWFEAYLGGRWYTFDPRNNVPRIGRVLMARGRDAIDVAIARRSGRIRSAASRFGLMRQRRPDLAAVWQIATLTADMRMDTDWHIVVAFGSFVRKVGSNAGTRPR
jgi:transglutaminase-like putative cysteine protease